MANIFGSIFMSKEERQRRFEEYSKKIFPYGDVQREKIFNLLGELFPDDKQNYLLMFYILIKEKILDREAADFDEVYKKISKKRIVKDNPRLKPVIKTILEVDLNIDEKLNYPTVEELRNI